MYQEDFIGVIHRGSGEGLGVICIIDRDGTLFSLTSDGTDGVWDSWDLHLLLGRHGMAWSGGIWNDTLGMDGPDMARRGVRLKGMVWVHGGVDMGHVASKGHTHRLSWPAYSLGFS